MDPIEHLAARAAASKILVLGDLMADKYIWGDQLRLGREAPVPVMRRVREAYEMGGAARVARGLKTLGSEVLLCGIVGFDDAAFSLRQLITATGIGTGGLFPSESRPTTLKVRLMSEEHRALLFRLDSEATNPLSERELASLRGYIDAMLAEVEALVLCDYQKGTFSSPTFDRWLLDSATQRGVRTVVLSRPPGLGSFAGASFIVATAASAREFLYLRGRGFPADLKTVGHEMREILHCHSLVVIHEAGGLSAWSLEDGGLFVPCPAVNPGTSLEVEEAITSLVALGAATGIQYGEVLRLAGRAAAAVAAGVAGPISLDLLRSGSRLSHPPEERQGP
jgi:D-beta-D-heptose 7-phosphate kinase/D-beta-D-heptose 1-phosphate adenosyltransferase